MTLEQYERDQVRRDTLEAVAKELEARAGNTTYQAAWRAAARLIRAMKS